MKTYYTYIMTNKTRTVLYTGVTNNLRRRVEEHKSGGGSTFTTRYHLTELDWFAEFSDANDAIAEEKRIKGGRRKDKMALINELNPDWKDLSDELH